LVEKLENITTSYFKNEGDLIFVIGEDYEELGGSEYLQVIHDLVAGDSPKLNLKVEKDLHTTLLTLIDNKLINSAHDVSEGGILTCIAECCILDEENLIGAEVNIPVKTREDFSFFSETQSRVVVSVSPENKNQFEKYLLDKEIKPTLLGNVGGQKLAVNGKYEFNVKNLADIYYNAISRIMNSAEEL